MATKKKTTKRKTSSRPRNSGTYARTNAPKRPARVKSAQDLAREKEILGIVLISVSVLLLVNFILAPDPAAADIGAMGVVSLFFIRLLRFIAGSGAVALPLFLLVFGIFVCADKNNPSNGRLAGILFIFLAFLGFRQLGMELVDFREYLLIASAGTGGGVVGALLAFALLKTVGRVGAIILFSALLLIGLLLAFQTSLSALAGRIGRFFSALAALAAFRSSAEVAPRPSAEKRGRHTAPAALPEAEEAEAALLRSVPIFQHDEPAPVITEVPEQPPAAAPPPKNKFVQEFMPEVTVGRDETEIGERPQVLVRKPAMPPDTPDDAEAAPAVSAPAPLPTPRPRRVKPVEPAPAARESSRPAADGDAASYTLPPVSLIEPGLKVKNPRLNKAITENIGVLESTLESFGVRATVTQVVAGPAVTRYELQPAPGVKVSRITGLADDIALSLAAQSIRIEAPIPGKNAIGIEVSRKETDVVYFREMIESDEFQNSKSKLSFALGKNIGGECIIGNLAKMPHLLIAGSTGSGKSVCINTVICSLLYKARPDEVKLMLIDPKKVELTQYARLPHLIAPVVNDSKKASNALKWVVNEMENRYSLFVGASVKDFEGYNKANPEEPLPHIVVIIDELADLMMVARHDVEDSICRLAQMARAAGIHLVVATQRPSVDVITGLIKANIPSRISFAVSSYTDSRTILDMGGAEKLLGNGDMLYAPIGKNKPERIQGTFINESDVLRLVGYCAEQAAPSFSEDAVRAAEHGEKPGNGAGHEEDGDDLLYDAAMLIVSTGQASTSFLQRRLAIGNPRAARLMDMLQAKGVVGGPKGSKPRDILMTAEEIEAMYGNG